ncbi:cell number regulator 7 [Nicotiana tabacum]|uniref:Cell number regulator 7 n=1 Tax=Nicotiana tabacum TaxID=4097 RepID=A0A1S4BU98_TOBAC|nr:cell number regulator 7-like [Nicotiana tomentosiformis]XP_016492447.1 PREDICTED: cell number regulator 7-like [Nicotiana tabacum]
MTGTPVADSGAPGQWTTGLCGCCDDRSNCCVTCWCPCVTFGQNVEIIDKGTTSCAHAGVIYYCLAHVCCACVYTCTYRTKLRAYFSLPEDPCGDCLVHFCCLPCAVCQEYRELKNRGFDPSQGWMANAQKWSQDGVTVPPPIAPGMTR